MKVEQEAGGRHFEFMPIDYTTSDMSSAGKEQGSVNTLPQFHEAPTVNPLFGCPALQRLHILITLILCSIVRLVLQLTENFLAS